MKFVVGSGMYGYPKFGSSLGFSDVWYSPLIPSLHLFDTLPFSPSRLVP
jgi:hypothetical protein